MYGRTGPMGVTEQAFYIPHLRIRLPDGNKVLQDDERKDREYDNKRRLEQEFMIDGDEIDDRSTSETQFEKEMAKNKSNADRRIIQTIFDSSPDNIIDDESLDFDSVLDETVELNESSDSKDVGGMNKIGKNIKESYL